MGEVIPRKGSYLMAGMLEHLLPRDQALSRVVDALSLTAWRGPKASSDLRGALGALLSDDLAADAPYPPHTRSTRDGYAVTGADTLGGSPSSPAFLSRVGEVPMGQRPAFSLKRGECALIHTGGAVPDGADAVVMLEDCSEAGGLVEVRRAVQKGENLVRRGEEFDAGQLLLPRGTRLDTRSVGFLASLGIDRVDATELKVGVLSTGDEIVDISADPAPGQIRDVNSWTIFSLLKERGYLPERLGIVRDDRTALSDALERARREYPVVLLSGGSSVSERDFTPALLEALPPPGLLVRGLNMAPGKPALIAGSKDTDAGRLVVGLPGHPLSCLVVMWTVVLPLLSAMTTGEPRVPWKSLRLPADADVWGRAGVEEFVPCRLINGGVRPLTAKSAYVGTLRDADGFIRLSPEEETIRKGESAEVCLW